MEKTVYDSKLTAKTIGISLRTLYQWANAGKIRFETLRQGCVTKRLYNGDDVERLRLENQTAVLVPKKSPRTELVLAADAAKPPLDSMNVFLSCLDKAQKANEALLAQMETQAKIGADTLTNVVAQFFAAQKADRDDNRYRFDALRKDKHERLKSRHPHGAPATRRKT